jgi:hypothetical protein
LGYLHALQLALELTERSLLAAYPQLELINPFDHAPSVAVDACLADAILIHLSGLESAISRYRLLLRHPEYRQLALDLPF